MKKSLAAIAFFALAAAASLAAPVTIRLGYNNIPPNSPWSQGLERLASEWRRVTNGEVSLQIKHAQGDEKIILGKMNSGFLEACVFDSWGMRSVAEETFVLSIPSLIKTDEELAHVLDKLGPYLNERVEARTEPALTTVAVMQVGWIRFFSRYPVLNPEDLQKQKLSINANQTDIHQLWIALGFQINTSPGIMVQQLSSKIIDAFFTSPLWVASQWKSVQAHTPYMTEMKVAPVLASLYVKRDAWEKISSENREKIIAVSRTIVRDMEKETDREEKRVIAQLESKGLKVIKQTESANAKWEENFKSGLAKGADRSFSPAAFEKVRTLLEAFRKGKR